MSESPPEPQLNHDYEGLDVSSIKHGLANRMTYTVGKDDFTATERDWYLAIAFVVRDRLIERWMGRRRR